MTWSIEKQLRPLSDLLSPLIGARSLLSLNVVGSMASGRATLESDLDLLLITTDDPDFDEIVLIGEALRQGLAASFVNEALILLDSPAQDRPDLVVFPPGRRVQVLVHRVGWVRQSLDVQNWVFMSWASNHKTLAGIDLLSTSATPQLNESVLDEFDGLPSILRRIDTSLLVVDAKGNSNYLRKLARYASARIGALVEAFPELGRRRNTMVDVSGSSLDHIKSVREELRSLISEIGELLHRGPPTASGRS